MLVQIWSIAAAASGIMRGQGEGSEESHGPVIHAEECVRMIGGRQMLFGCTLANRGGDARAERRGLIDRVLKRGTLCSACTVM